MIKGIIHRSWSVWAVLIMACSGRTVCGQSDHTALLQQHLQAWEHDYYELLGSRGLRGGPPMEHVYQVLQQRLQDIIPERSPGALLFYHHAQDTLHSWLIRPKHLPLHSAHKAEAQRFVDWQEGLLSGLNVYSGQRGARTQHPQSQATSSRQLILKQMAEVLLPHELRPALDSLKHLLIIPALNISALPLYLLPIGSKDEPLSSKLSYSVLPSFRRLYAVAETYNEAQYDTMDTVRWQPKPGAVLSGNPAFPAKSNPGFYPLPGAAHEVATISGLTGIDTLPGKQLTPALLLRLLGTEYGPDFFYLACHGVSNPEHPIDSSFLLLAADMLHPDGRLSAREIQAARGIDPEVYNTDRDAWVFLSACETGMGQMQDAGITGLARAFVLAGARNVWISLWPVDDRAAAVFMPIVMEELQKPSPFFPAENFRRAVERFRTIDPNPAHWAAFSLMGVPYPVHVNGLLEP
jgi:CHAT domain-containing protein